MLAFKDFIEHIFVKISKPRDKSKVIGRIRSNIFKQPGQYRAIAFITQSLKIPNHEIKTEKTKTLILLVHIG